MTRASRERAIRRSCRSSSSSIAEVPTLGFWGLLIAFTALAALGWRRADGLSPAPSVPGAPRLPMPLAACRTRARHRSRGAERPQARRSSRAKLSGSMLAPQTMTPTRLPPSRCGSGPQMAAVAAAPAGSTASLAPRSSRRIASRSGLVVDQHQVVEETPAEGERVGRGVRRAEAVGDRAHLVDRLRGARPRSCGAWCRHRSARRRRRGSRGCSCLTAPAIAGAQARRRRSAPPRRRASPDLPRELPADGRRTQRRRDSPRTGGRRLAPPRARSAATSANAWCTSSTSTTSAPKARLPATRAGLARPRHHHLGRGAERAGRVADRHRVVAGAHRRDPRAERRRRRAPAC